MNPWRQLLSSWPSHILQENHRKSFIKWLANTKNGGEAVSEANVIIQNRCKLAYTEHQHGSPTKKTQKESISEFLNCIIPGIHPRCWCPSRASTPPHTGLPQTHLPRSRPSHVCRSLFQPWVLAWRINLGSSQECKSPSWRPVAISFELFMMFTRPSRPKSCLPAEKMPHSKKVSSSVVVIQPWQGHPHEQHGRPL